MKIGLMFKDISTSLFHRPVTERYPFVRKDAPERLRAKLTWNLEKCTGCGLCELDCPASAIQVHVLDRKEKRFVLEYHADRCTFCAQCVHSCKQGCIQLSNTDWELAALDADAFHFLYGDQTNVNEFLAGGPSAGPESPATA